jgi:predicted component of viral defense system (DUF524 family)
MQQISKQSSIMPSCIYVHIRSVLSEHVPPEFRLLNAINTVLRDPHRQLERVRRAVPLEAVRQVEPSLLDDLAAGQYPLVRPENANLQHLSLVRHLRGYTPEYVSTDQGEITFDTPENRFVKAFLDYALIVISHMRQFIEGKSSENSGAFQRRVLEECDQMEYLLRPSRQHALWKEIGSMVHVPVSSTVLQRRQGYREIFGHYSRMHLATKVPFVQKIEQDLLEAKDIARLYELWCYFACVRQLELLLGPPVKAGRLEAKVTELTVPRGDCSGMAGRYETSLQSNIFKILQEPEIFLLSTTQARHCVGSAKWSKCRNTCA